MILLIIICVFVTGGIASAQSADTDTFHAYFGSLHNHCAISDGTGTAFQAYAAAKEKYDFFGLSDHAEMMNPTEWITLRAAADSFNLDSSFTTLWGYEWSSPIYGHALIVGTNNTYSAASFFANFERLVDWVDGGRGVAFFNHPGDYDAMGEEFNHFSGNSSANFVGMELWNGILKFDHYYFCNGYRTDDNGLSYYDEALHRGWKIGASGAEDNHSATWGALESRMAVLAKALTRDDLMNAMRKRRFYSTLDRNLYASFRIRDNEMGSILVPGIFQGQITLRDGDGETFTKVEILLNGFVNQVFEIRDANPVIRFEGEAMQGDYYYMRVYQQDGDMAIGSPIFFDELATGNTDIEQSADDLTEDRIHVWQVHSHTYLEILGSTTAGKIGLVDITGRLVFQKTIYPGERIPLDEHIPRGCYLLFLTDHPERKAIKIFLN
jgi:hypothetical protein